MTEHDPADGTTMTPSSTPLPNLPPLSEALSDLLLLPELDQIGFIFLKFGMSDEGVHFLTTTSFIKKVSFEKFRRRNVYDLIKKLDDELLTESELGISVDDLIVFCAIQLALYLGSDGPRHFFPICTTLYFEHLFAQIDAANNFFDMVANLPTHYMSIPQVALHFVPVVPTLTITPAPTLVAPPFIH